MCDERKESLRKQARNDLRLVLQKLWEQQVCQKKPKIIL